MKKQDRQTKKVYLSIANAFQLLIFLPHRLLKASVLNALLPMTRLKLYSFILFFLAYTPINAQQQMDLQQCIKIALEENLNLDMQEKNIALTTYNNKQAVSGLYPGFNFKSQFTDNIELPPITVPGAAFGRPGELLSFRFGTRYQANIGVSVQQQLFNLPLFYQPIIGKKMLFGAKTSYMQQKENLIYQVGALYYQLQYALQTLEMSRSQIELLDSLIIVMDERITYGNAVSMDRNMLMVQRNNSDNLNQNAQLQYADVYQQMLVVLNYPTDTLVNFPISAEEWKAIQQPSFHFDNLLTYQLMENKLDLAKSQLKKVNKERYPSVYAFANMSYQNLHDDFSSVINGSWDYGMAVGLGVEFSIFNGLVKNYEIRKHRLYLRQAEIERDAIKQQLRSSYDVAKNKLTSTFMQLTNQQGNLKLAETVLHDYQNEYLAGTLVLSDFLNAQNTYQVAYINYLNAIVNYQMARIECLKASGRIMELISENRTKLLNTLSP